MTRQMKSSDKAVSPVVGVMLMLVVTIVIAAVVAAFAGGLSTTQSVTPAVTMDAKLSNADGLTLTSLGVTSGDNTEFGIYITNGQFSYNIGSGTTGKFTAGTTRNIPISTIQNSFVKQYGDSETLQKSGGYVGEANIGTQFTVKLIATNGGNIVGQKTVTLTA